MSKYIIRLKEILEITYMGYPILVAIFFIYDFLTFKQFGFETGFFIEMFQTLDTSASNLIILIVLLPLFILLLLAIALKVSKELSLTIFKISFNFLQKYFYWSIFLIFSLYLLIYYFFFSFNDYFFALFVFFVLQSLYYFLWLLIFSLDLKKHKTIILIIFIIPVIFHLIEVLILSKNTILLQLWIINWLTLALQGFKEPNKSTSVSNFDRHARIYLNLPQEIQTNKNERIFSTNNTIEIYKILNIMSVVILLFLAVSFYTSNRDIWNNSLNSGNTANTFNALFNRGFLINNTDDINITGSNEANITKISKNDHYQYLNIGNNYKIFFKNSDNNNSITALIIKEKEFANQIGSEYTLIKMSKFDTNNTKN